MKLLKKSIGILLIAAMVLSMIGCGNKAADNQQKTEVADSSSAENTSAEGIGDHDQDIVVAVNYDIAGYDTNTRQSCDDWNVYYLIYDRLFEHDENANAIPHLVEEKIEVSDTEIQYKIHQGAKFSDGSEVKAVDVAASILYACESGIGGDMYAPIESVEALDDYTVSFKLSTAYPQLDVALADPLCSILPASFLEAAKKDSSVWAEPICSGRYIIKDRVTGSSTTLVPNEYFWDEKTAAKNDSITFKVVPEASTRTIMVQTGEADLCDYFSASDIEVAEKDANVTIYPHASSLLYYIFLNYENPIFHVKEVRQALNYAVDRAAFVAVQENGYGTVNECYAAPCCMGWLDNPAGITYDPEKAKELLAAGGYPDGFEFDLHCDPTFNDSAALLQAELAEIGVKVNIVNVEQMGDVIPLVNQNQCDAAIVCWGFSPEDTLNTPLCLGENGIGANNFARYVNPELEKLWAKGYDPDPEKRIEAYHEWEEIICEECPWITLYVSEVRALANKDLKGVEMNCMIPMNLYNLTYK